MSITSLASLRMKLLYPPLKSWSLWIIYQVNQHSIFASWTIFLKLIFCPSSICKLDFPSNSNILLIFSLVPLTTMYPWQIHFQEFLLDLWISCIFILDHHLNHHIINLGCGHQVLKIYFALIFFLSLWTIFSRRPRYCLVIFILPIWYQKYWFLSFLWLIQLYLANLNLHILDLNHTLSANHHLPYYEIHRISLNNLLDL